MLWTVHQQITLKADLHFSKMGTDHIKTGTVPGMQQIPVYTAKL